MKTRHLITFIAMLTFCLSAESASAQNKQKNHIDFARLKNFQDKTIIISGHRGGMEGFPENSKEVFANVLTQLPAFFEIDPRLTKDSTIVLMHDATLNRTTNGDGLLANYTWNELQNFKLKERSGKITTFTAPKLEDLIRWSKGKTVFNLDKKDVPPAMIVELIKKCRAEKHIMLTVHTGAQARYYYEQLPNVMLSAFCRNTKEYDDMANSGVPWENMIAYVGTSINADNEHIVKLLHERKVKCMVSFAPTIDRVENEAERARQYLEEIAKQPDIIETDRPIELSKLLPQHK